jgi:predicted secreted hydrolase
MAMVVRGLSRLGALAVLVVTSGCQEPVEPDAARTGMRFVAGEDGGGFATVRDVRPFVFPDDHGAHEEYRSEWWYFTGNLDSAEGRHFGFELTFFRFGLSPQEHARTSEWATNQAWMAHFGLTNTAEGDFHASERFARGALGLAGSSAEPLRIWVDDWGATGRADAHAIELRLQASDQDRAIDLTVEAVDGVVLQGDRGVDAKGPEPGNASYYYSIPRLAAHGTVTLGDDAIPVSGYVWLDREWGTSALGEGIEGWDWFALQLDDGRDVMFYRLRREDGTSDPHSGGTIRAPDGTVERLGADAVVLEATRRWRSPSSGVQYPIAWRLRFLQPALEIELEPYLDRQEMNLAVRYWEGAVRLRGRDADGPVSGRGYVELAGY